MAATSCGTEARTIGVGATRSAPTLIGHSPGMAAVRRGVANAARTAAPVLILGETGVGKDVVARAIHAVSDRRHQPFVAINCCGIAESLLESELFGHTRGSFTGAVRDRAGLLQQAHRGTLFLDELGDMSLRMQAALLRFLDTGEVQRVGADAGGARSDVRVLTATNRQLHRQIADGVFREDLYYRLNVLRIDVPPLRDRGEDVVLLWTHFLSEAARTYGIPTPAVTPAALQQVVAYDWPGNVRELRNVTERLAVHDQGGPVTMDDLLKDILGQQRRLAPVTPGEGNRGQAREATSGRAAALFAQLVAGDVTWGEVQEQYRSRALTRSDLTGLIDLGLSETRGNYRGLIHLFGLDDAEYKRFHAFLYQRRCNLPVGPYRQIASVSGARRSHALAQAST